MYQFWKIDYGLIQLWIKDHYKEGFNDRSIFRMLNMVIRFGTETKYPVCKFILRLFYKELKVCMDEKNKRIPGKISDERLYEILYIIEELIHDYYFMMRFREDN